MVCWVGQQVETRNNRQALSVLLHLFSKPKKHVCLLLYLVNGFQHALQAANLKLIQASSLCSTCVMLLQGALGTMLELSRQVCLQTYEKELFHEDSHIQAAERWQLGFTPVQLAVFGGLYAWRDKLARQLDESLGYVLPKGQMATLARKMPATVSELVSVLGRHGSPLALQHAAELVKVIARAKLQAGGAVPSAVLHGIDSSAMAEAGRGVATGLGSTTVAHQGDMVESGTLSNKATTNGVQPGAEAASTVDVQHVTSACIPSATNAALQPKTIAPLLVKRSAAGAMGSMFGSSRTAGAGASSSSLSSLGGSLAASRAKLLAPGINADHSGRPADAECKQQDNAVVAGAAVSCHQAQPDTLPQQSHTQPTTTSVHDLTRADDDVADDAKAAVAAPKEGTQQAQLPVKAVASLATAAQPSAMAGGGRGVHGPPTAAVSAVHGMMGATGLTTGHQVAQQPHQMDAVERLKASFVLPFAISASTALSNSAASALCGAPAAATSSGAHHGPQQAAAAAAGEDDATAGPPAKLHKTTAQDIRTAMDALRNETGAETAGGGRGESTVMQQASAAETSAQVTAATDGPEDTVMADEDAGVDMSAANYIPMSLTAAYNMKRSKPRQQRNGGTIPSKRPDAQWGVAGGPGSSSQAQQQPTRNIFGDEAQLQQLYKETGLVDEEDDEDAGSSDEDDSADEALGDATARGQRHKMHKAATAGSSGPEIGNGDVAWGRSQQPAVAPFDYAGAAAERQAALRGRGGRGRGGDDRGRRGSSNRGRGRRGRGRGRAEAYATAAASLAAVRSGGRGVAFNPFDIPEEHLIKGGKRSSVAPRSGNRSYSFK